MKEVSAYILLSTNTFTKCIIQSQNIDSNDAGLSIGIRYEWLGIYRGQDMVQSWYNNSSWSQSKSHVVNVTKSMLSTFSAVDLIIWQVLTGMAAWRESWRHSASGSSWRTSCSSWESISPTWRWTFVADFVFPRQSHRWEILQEINVFLKSRFLNKDYLWGRWRWKPSDPAWLACRAEENCSRYPASFLSHTECSSPSERTLLQKHSYSLDSEETVIWNIYKMKYKRLTSHWW